MGVTQVSWITNHGATGNANGTSNWTVSGIALQSGTNIVTLYTYKTLSSRTACTNAVFGDPAPGLAKQCDTGSTSPSTGSWSVCATEGGVCAFNGTKQVRYGANGSYIYKTLSKSTACTNAVFGDPAPGIAKQCAIGGTSIVQN